MIASLRKKKMYSLVLTIVLISGMVLPCCESASAAESYTTQTNLVAVIWNTNGLLYSFNTVSWVSIDGVAYDDELRMDRYDVSGAIVNGKSYYFNIAQVHVNSNFYSEVQI